MAQTTNQHDLIAQLHALEEELGSRDDIRIDDAAMTIVHTSINTIVASIEQAFPVEAASEQQIHLLQTILLHDWETRPSDDELDGYWFLRGIVHRFCQEQNLVEDNHLPRLLQFIHVAIIGDAE